jgi:acyl dehydratase
MTDVKFPHPLFEGDTVHCTTDVIGKRESKSRPGAGIVEFHHRAGQQARRRMPPASVHPDAAEVTGEQP